MLVSTFRSGTDPLLVSQALQTNAALRGRSFAVIESAGEGQRAIVAVEANMGAPSMRTLATAKPGDEVVIAYATNDGASEISGRLVQVHEVSRLRSAIEDAAAPMAYTLAAASGFIAAVQTANQGTFAVMALATTAFGIGALARYFWRKSGSDFASKFIAASVATRHDQATLRRLEPTPALAAKAPLPMLPAPSPLEATFALREMAVVQR